MAPRAVGALLGLAAAALLAVSLVTPAWWDGHPRVDGHTITAKAAHIGLYGATGCNIGGDGDCTALPQSGMARTAGYGELGVAGLAALLALLLGTSALRGSERGKPLAKATLPLLGLAALGGGALLLLGPGLQASQEVEVPVGWGLLVFYGGVVAGGLSAVSALTAKPEPLRLKIAPQPPPPAPAFDVRELLRDQHDALRPSALGPEPVLGGPAPAYAATDPHRLAHAPAPLFEGAPQLRALYDQDGAGFVPAPAKPALPERAPTPLPRAAVGAIAGIPTPPGISASPFHEPKAIAAPRAMFHDDRPDSQPIEPPPPAVPLPAVLPSRPSGKTLPPPAGKTLPPPIRSKSPSVAPVVPPVPPVPPRGSAPVIEPAERRSRPQIEPGEARRSAATLAPVRPIVPMPERSEKRSKPTITYAVPPPPTMDTQPPPVKLPAGQGKVRLSTEQDDRLETAMRETEAITAVEIDAEAKAAAVAKRGDARPESVTGQLAGQVGDRTDVGVEMPDGKTGQTAEMASAEQDAPAADAPAEPPPPAAPAPPAPASRSSAPHVPISTAPASLPPPKEANVATSGPTPACPQCEAPMAWVEEHLRFYCKQCRMYF